MSGAATPAASRIVIGFAWIGHTLMHILAGLYLTIVLVLESEWHMSYDELLRLWTLGSLLIGLGAPLGGWLGDRWSDTRMLGVFFLMTGAGAVVAGVAPGPTGLWLGLALLGLGASIYHPVGMSLVVRHSATRGKAMAWFGIFGTFGVAFAGVIAGGLSDLAGWRSAFLVPGVLCLILGAALFVLVGTGRIMDRKADLRPHAPASRGDVVRAFFILSVTMVCGGMMFACLQIVLPKLFMLEVGSFLGDSVLGVGGLVTVVNLIGAGPQLIGGQLADRLPLKRVYIASLITQTAMMAILASLGGMVVVAAAALVTIVMQFQAPAENLLLTRYTPDRHRGLVFGAKFILTFGVGPLSVQLVAALYERFGGFQVLYLCLAGLAALGVAAALLLPDDRKAEPAPAVA